MLYTAWQLVACCVGGCHSAHASASDALPCPVSLGQRAAGDLRAAPACCAGGEQRRPWPSVEEGAARDRRWQQLARCGAGRGGAAGRGCPAGLVTIGPAAGRCIFSPFACVNCGFTRQLALPAYAPARRAGTGFACYPSHQHARPPRAHAPARLAIYYGPSQRGIWCESAFRW